MRQSVRLANMFAVDIAASFLIEHRFDPQHDIDDRPNQHGHDIAVVILIHFFELTGAALHFDLAHQAVWAMPVKTIIPLGEFAERTAAQIFNHHVALQA